MNNMFQYKFEAKILEVNEDERGVILVLDQTAFYPPEPIPLEKENPAAVRLLTWNTLHDGLDDIERQGRGILPEGTIPQVHLQTQRHAGDQAE